MSNQRALFAALDAAARRAGAHSFAIEPAGKRLRAIIGRDGRTRTVFLSKTASDHRAQRNMVRDIKHALRDLGANN